MTLKTEEILNGLSEGNEPSEYDGVKGYWCQADCIFIPADDPALAVQKYRESFSSGGPFNIGVSHNDGCDGIARVKIVDNVVSAATLLEFVQKRLVDIKTPTGKWGLG